MTTPKITVIGSINMDLVTRSPRFPQVGETLLGSGFQRFMGGKGANLAEMTNIGLPVPQGFTISTESCTQYYEDGRKINDEIQSQIMDEYNAAQIGKTLEVLVDGYDEEQEQFYGRTYADSPDIDGRVWIGSEEPLHEGDFVMVTVDGTVDGDLTGYVQEA